MGVPILQAPSRAPSPIQLAPIETVQPIMPHDGDIFHETNPDDQEAPASEYIPSCGSTPKPEE